MSHRKKIIMAFGLNIMHRAEIYHVDFDDLAFEGCGVSMLRITDAKIDGEQGLLWHHNEFWDCSFDKIETEKFEVVRNNISNTIFSSALFKGGSSLLLQNQLFKITFVKCNFFKLNMNFNIFTDCSFDNCYFQECNIKNNTFENCSFYENIWSCCTMENNDTTSSSFEKDWKTNAPLFISS